MHAVLWRNTAWQLVLLYSHSVWYWRVQVGHWLALPCQVLRCQSFAGTKSNIQMKCINPDFHLHNKWQHVSNKAQGTFICWDQVLCRISIVLENENLLGWKSMVLRDLTKNRLSDKFHRDATAVVLNIIKQKIIPLSWIE